MFHGEVIEELKFRLYIPFGGNLDLLKKCVESVAVRISKFTTWHKPIVVINNTLIPLPDDFPYKYKIEEHIPPVELVHAQEINWIIKLSQEAKEDFAMNLHADAELVDGAIEDVIDKWEEVKGTKWAQILQYASGVFGALNWRFFAEEDVEFDPFMFPFYFMDNHMYKIIESRGWVIHLTKLNGQIPLVHKSSHYLKENPTFEHKNAYCFPLSGMLYSHIWGGGPGAETRLDPTAGGTLRMKG